MADKKFKSIKIKQFKDLNMWAAPMGAIQGPDKSNVRGSQMMQIEDMQTPGNTGNDGANSHTNIERN